MTKHFEVGAYCHTLKEIDAAKLDHATLLEAPENLLDVKKKYPDLQLSSTTPHRGIHEITLRAHKGLDLEKECRALLKKGLQVRVALPSNLFPSLKIQPLASLDVKIDLMAFDYADPSDGRTNFHTVLFAWEGPSVVKTLEALHGIPLKKISLGLATFGVLFKNVPPGMSNTGYGQPCDPAPSPALSSAALSKYRQDHPSAKLFYTFLHGCFQSFIYNPDNGDWISFDDPHTLKSKTSWARAQGFRGIFFY
jgi:glycosyl hydrolase family 18 (putative chitinase)